MSTKKPISGQPEIGTPRWLNFEILPIPPQEGDRRKTTSWSALLAIFFRRSLPRRRGGTADDRDCASAVRLRHSRPSGPRCVPGGQIRPRGSTTTTPGSTMTRPFHRPAAAELAAMEPGAAATLDQGHVGPGRPGLRPRREWHGLSLNVIRRQDVNPRKQQRMYCACGSIPPAEIKSVTALYSRQICAKAQDAGAQICFAPDATGAREQANLRGLRA